MGNVGMRESKNIEIAKELIKIAKQLIEEPMNKEQAQQIATKHIVGKIELKSVENYSVPLYGVNLEDYFVFQVISNVPRLGGNEYIAVNTKDPSIVKSFTCGE